MFCGYLRNCRFILYGYAAANCQVIVPFSDKFERVPPLRFVHTLTKTLHPFRLSSIHIRIYEAYTILRCQFCRKLGVIVHGKAGCAPVSELGNVTLHYFAGEVSCKLLSYEE